MLYIYQTKCDTCQTQECLDCKENISSALTNEELEQLMNELKTPTSK